MSLVCRERTVQWWPCVMAHTPGWQRVTSAAHADDRGCPVTANHKSLWHCKFYSGKKKSCKSSHSRSIFRITTYLFFPSNHERQFEDGHRAEAFVKYRLASVNFTPSCWLLYHFPHNYFLKVFLPIRLFNFPKVRIRMMTHFGLRSRVNSDVQHFCLNFIQFM